MLSAAGLRVHIGARPVLRDVDLTLRPGELLGLVGANGAGKSTLLRVLAGLQPPEAGHVMLDGKALASIDRQHLARLRAYLPQERAVHWPLTAAELVGLGRLPHGAADPGSQEAVARALRRTGTLALAGRRVDEMSGGERARVLLARALAVEAPVLLADEPIAGLDPLQQIRTLQVLRALGAESVAVIAVLHDLTLASRFCDRLVLLHEGTALAAGVPEDVLTDANLASAFGISVRRFDGVVLPWQELAPE